MAPSQSTLLLFGDQTGDIVSATRELLSLSAHSPPLRSFIQRAEQAIQREGRHHQHHLPADLLSASSLLSLAAANSATRHPAIRTLLFTVVQLGNLIYYAEKRIDTSTSTRTTKILASCTGLLPAAVIATSRSLAEIVDLSTAVVVLALKVGLAAARRSETIEENSERKSWAVAVAGVHPEQCTEILKEFHEANVGVISKPHRLLTLYSPTNAEHIFVQVGIYQRGQLRYFDHRVRTPIDPSASLCTKTRVS